MAIGYIGLGNMGAPMARRLIARHELLVHDANPTAVQRMVDAGAIACPDLAEMARRCDIVMLCLPSSAYVHRVIFGEGGLSAGLRPGALIVDQTSGEPKATREMAAELAKRDVWFVDAPVSGGPEGAEAGTVAIIVGATIAHYEQLLPIFHEIGANVFHAGEVGAANVAKLANNLVSICLGLANIEAMALAVKNGIEPRRAYDILMASSGRNHHLEKIVGPHMLTGKLAAGFTVGVPHKDIKLACALGQESGMPMFFGNLAKELYEIYAKEIGDNAPGPAIALVMDRLASTKMVPDGHSMT